MRHWNNGTDHRHSKSCCDKSSPARRTIIPRVRFRGAYCFCYRRNTCACIFLRMASYISILTSIRKHKLIYIYIYIYMRIIMSQSLKMYQSYPGILSRDCETSLFSCHYASICCQETRYAPPLGTRPKLIYIWAPISFLWTPHNSQHFKCQLVAFIYTSWSVRYEHLTPSLTHLVVAILLHDDEGLLQKSFDKHIYRVWLDIPCNADMIQNLYIAVHYLYISSMV